MNLEVEHPSVYIFNKYVKGVGFPGGSVGKESAFNAGDAGKRKFDPQGPQVGRILWRRAWQPTPVFLPGEFPDTSVGRESTCNAGDPS